MKNSFVHSGVSNSQGYNGNSGAAGPSRLIITGVALGGEHWWQRV